MRVPVYERTGNIYRCGPFQEIDWLEHGFGTRHSPDWAAGPRLTTLKQIHSHRALLVREPGGCAGEGDALVSDQPGCWLGVRTADCFPILVVDTRRRAVAAIHAGWRGTAAGIAAATVRAMTGHFFSRPADLCVAIGPGIGVCCYEVGPEVTERFADLFPGLTGRARLDLAEANRRQFLQAGVPLDRIFCVNLCTCCGPQEFHSYRRDKGKGRMVSAIGIHPRDTKGASGKLAPP